MKEVYFLSEASMNEKIAYYKEMESNWRSQIKRRIWGDTFKTTGLFVLSLIPLALTWNTDNKPIRLMASIIEILGALSYLAAVYRMLFSRADS